MLDNTPAAFGTSPVPSDALLKNTADLIAFDTTSRNSNLGLIETVRDDLVKAGFQSFLTYDLSGSKANLFATLPADNGSVTGGLCLSGHVDTVPVDGQEWTSDPFAACVRDGKLFGRGACDMKGFVAAALTVASAFSNRARPVPVHLALSYDEELGCLGAPDMVREIVSRGYRPEGCVVGEPTGMGIICGHKGANVGRVDLAGVACHSSKAPEGVNAIEYASELVTFMKEMGGQFAQEGPFDENYDIPFSTLQTGRISGGNAVNTVPAECQIDFEFRNLPAVPADRIKGLIETYLEGTIVPQMRDKLGAGTAQIAWPASVPAFEADETAGFTKLAREIAADHARQKVAYGTEAGIFAQAGIPTIVCGPGDIAQAHIADEFVALEQLAQCETFLTTLLDSYPSQNS